MRTAALSPQDVQSTRRAPDGRLPDPEAIGFEEFDAGSQPLSVEPVQAQLPTITNPRQDGIPNLNSVPNFGASFRQQPQVDPNWVDRSTTGTAPATTGGDNSSVATAIAPQIATRLVSPQSINLNEPATVRIQIQNTSRMTATNISLSTVVPGHAIVNTSNPAPTSTEGRTLNYVIAQIAAGQIQEIELEVIPTEKKPLQLSTSIEIKQNQQVDVAVYEPQLKIDVAGPESITLGRWATHTVTVTNIGDGIARNVQLNRQLPEGLQPQSAELPAPIAELGPGEARQIQLKSLAIAPGQFDLAFAVGAKSCETRNATGALQVYQPELQVSATSPEFTFINRDGLYSIQVDNEGEVDVNNVQVSVVTPPGIKITTISREASIDEETGRLIWNFDKIAAAASEVIQMKAVATEPGRQVCELFVGSSDTSTEKFELITQVQTHADVSISLINQSGPIEVGSRTNIVVEVENRGSRAASGVEVAIELAPSLVPVANNTYQVNEVDNTIRFTPMNVPAGETATLSFSVAGAAKGEHVVRGIVRVADSSRRLMAEDSVFVFESDQSRVSESLTPEVNKR
ncbi:MAG: hypothetical protein AAF456_04515 [Planctomycetota bacterium]